MRVTDRNHERGMALMEFALVLPLMLMLLVAGIDFGHLIQTRLILTNVSREGGSVASRTTSITPELTNMVLASGSPLNLAGGDGRVYITRIAAGTSTSTPKPTIAKQIFAGLLAKPSKVSTLSATLGLSPRLYDRLVYKTTNGTADISEVTVVEVIYRYRPITPLPGFMAGMLDVDNGGFVISSKAVF
jgi:Flp pilus assembly protein TadG